MAAPKNWGYTRNQPIPDEILVSWADGDLTAVVAKEVVERLLIHPEERMVVAGFARAAEDTRGGEETVWHGKMPGERKLFLQKPRPGLVQSIVEGGLHSGDWSGAAPAEGGLRLRPTQIAGGIVLLALTLLVVLWMVQNL